MVKFSLESDSVEEEERSCREAKRRRTCSCSSREVGGEEIGLGVTIDSDLLDCSICFHPLRPPLYQCMNGHVACSSCRSKLPDKCHICTLPVPFRNIALEKVLESVHLPCIYAHFGCRLSISYSQRQLHADTCPFGPSSCPIPACSHRAFPGGWLAHFIEDHKYPNTSFLYGESHTVIFNEGHPYFVFSGPDNHLFLLVNQPLLNMGNALSLHSIDPPHQDQNVLSYRLIVGTDSGTNACSLQFKSQVSSIKEWKKGELHGYFLLVPLRFSISGQMEVHVVIKKNCDVISSE
ncbi:E3 ubiquitin-protein ligase [Rhynchospora pubera]|uniref:RING-type E3 ubiquitin transferase n=1 Tax=Rhynchospora pubera TaxID=906938 RepID=A0AAV8G2J2_9POAL|nr:E3 ubiquitin-protein ligase [Rhynchospora pubera]